jgi:hypothetical protein
MAGLVPVIPSLAHEGVDARPKAGHDVLLLAFENYRSGRQAWWAMR